MHAVGLGLPSQRNIQLSLDLKKTLETLEITEGVSCPPRTLVTPEGHFPMMGKSWTSALGFALLNADSFTWFSDSGSPDWPWFFHNNILGNDNETGNQSEDQSRNDKEEASDQLFDEDDYAWQQERPTVQFLSTSCGKLFEV